MDPVQEELDRELDAIRTMMPARRRLFVKRYGRPRGMSHEEYLAWVMEDPTGSLKDES